jgi:hypothetical protein
VPHNSEVEAKQLKASFHSLQTQNELLRLENDNLTHALAGKEKQKKKRYKLDLQQRKEYHGGALFWSPRKLCEARTRKAVKRDEAKQLQLQKSRDRELKVPSRLYNRQQAEAAKVGFAGDERLW